MLKTLPSMTIYVNVEHNKNVILLLVSVPARLAMRAFIALSPKMSFKVSKLRLLTQ